MEGQLQFRLGALAEKELVVGKRDERGAGWLPQKRGRGIVSGELQADEDRVLQLVNGPCKDPRATAVQAPSPLLLHELAQMSNAGGGTLFGFRQAAADVSRMASNGSASLFGIQPNDDGACRTPTLELDSCNNSPLPYGWEKCLDLQTGSIYYLNRCTGLTTSLDPRMAPPPSFQESRSHVLNTVWPPPTSPSSASSEITFEGAVPRPPSCNGEGMGLQRPSAPPVAESLQGSLPSSASPSVDCQHPYLDLSLTLRPYSASPKRQSPESWPVSRINIASMPPSPQAPPCLGSLSTPVNRSSADLSSTSVDSSKLFYHHQMGEVSRSVGMAPMPAAGRTSQSHEQTAGVERMVQSGSVHPRLLDQRLPNETTKAANFSMKGAYGDDDRKEDASLMSSMITGGCGNCLMFVMVPRTSLPKCPRCGTHIDINAPCFTAAECTRTVSSDRLMSRLSQPSTKKAKLLLPAALSLKVSCPTLEPAVSLL